MSAAQVEELKAKVKAHEMDRPALIKALRHVRMTAINDEDKETLKLFADPVEVIADRMIAEVRK